jgi:transposase InsO family protein
LKFLQDQRSLSSGLLRWIDIISAYSFTVVHRPGILHVLPDALSRMFSLAHANNEPWGTQPAIKYTQVADTQLSPSDVLSVDSINKEREKCEARYTKFISTHTYRRRRKSKSSPSIASLSSPTHTHAPSSPILPSKGGGASTYTASVFRLPQTSDDFHFDVNDDDAMFVSNEVQKPVVTSDDVEFNLESDEQETGELMQAYEDGVEFGAFAEVQRAFVASYTPPQPDELAVYDPETNTHIHVSHSDLSAFNDTLNADDTYTSPSFSSDLVASLERLTLATPQVAVITPDSTMPITGVTPTLTPVAVSLPSSTDPSLSTHDSQTLRAVAQRGLSMPLPNERPALLARAHALGHLGVTALHRHLYHLGYWWPGMRIDVERLVASCDECLRYNIGKTGYHPLRPRNPAAILPGDHWQIDLAKFPRSRDGFCHCLVIVDMFTGFIILRALEHESAEAVARALWETICLIGPPRYLQHDRGSHFVNALIATMCRLSGVERLITSPYHPQADGKVERVIGDVKLIISKMLHGSFAHWPLFLPMVQLSYNARISRITGSSPYVLFYGRPLNEFRDFSKEGAPVVDLNAWQQHQKQMLSVIYPAIALRATRMSDKMREDFAKRRAHVLLPDLIPGTVVTIKDPRFLKGKVRPTTSPKYTGQKFIVVKRATQGCYILRDLEITHSVFKSPQRNTSVRILIY